jgi:hypothetical protein
MICGAGSDLASLMKVTLLLKITLFLADCWKSCSFSPSLRVHVYRGTLVEGPTIIAWDRRQRRLSQSKAEEQVGLAVPAPSAGAMRHQQQQRRNRQQQQHHQQHQPHHQRQKQKHRSAAAAGGAADQHKRERTPNEARRARGSTAAALSSDSEDGALSTDSEDGALSTDSDEVRWRTRWWEW